MKPPVILHVEDDPNDVFLLNRAVKRAGLDVQMQNVPDGQKAIEYLSASGSYADRRRFAPPELVLLDLKIPILSGFEVLAWIRARTEFKEMPVLVVTSSNYPADLQKARQLGADEYLIKTATFEEVIQSVKPRLPAVRESAKKPAANGVAGAHAPSTMEP
jgi:CheY-like chemotaxis protein